MADRVLSDCQAATIKASSAWSAERRAACVTLLEGAARRIGEAIATWEGTLEAPDAGAVPFTAMVHVGAERARRLQQLYFDQKTLAAELSELTGFVYRDALGMDDSIAIVQPYDQFGTEESVHERARRAIETMQGRAERLAETIMAVRPGPEQAAGPDTTLVAAFRRDRLGGPEQRDDT